MGSTLFIHTARYAGRCFDCGGDIIRGDKVATIRRWNPGDARGGPKRTLCYICTRTARGHEATALDHRLSAYAAGKRTTAPHDADAAADAAATAADSTD